MKHTEKAAFDTALPSRRRPAAEVTDTVAVRVSARATSATTPSRKASNSTAATEKWSLATQARTTNITASNQCSTGSTTRAGRWSSRATAIGEISAGMNWADRKNAVVPKALPVWRYTSSASATEPIMNASSLSA